MPKDVYLRWHVKYGHCWSGFQHIKHAKEFLKQRSEHAVCELWDNDIQSKVSFDQ